MKSLTFTTLLLATAIGFTGCGGGGSSEPAASAEKDSGVNVIKVTGNDQMQYNIKEIRAKAGELIRIEMTNIGKLPAAAMSHNWVLLKSGVSEADLIAFATACSQNPPSYFVADTDLVLAHTKMLGPGASDSIEFLAPATPGVHDYLCTFPGHYVMMRGKLIVE